MPRGCVVNLDDLRVVAVMAVTVLAVAIALVWFVDHKLAVLAAGALIGGQVGRVYGRREAAREYMPYLRKDR